MKKLITARNLIIGDEMKLLKNGYLLIENGRIVEIGDGNKPIAGQSINLSKCTIIPGLINAHTHVGDSAFQDIGFGRTLEELFKPPHGLKHKLLSSAPQAAIIKACRETVFDMLHSGTTTFADFRENGAEGVKMLLRALEGIKMRVLIFGRPDHTFRPEELEANTAKLPKEALDSIEQVDRFICGYAPSAPNDYTDEALRQLASLARKHGKIRATHVAESPDSLKISKSRAGLSDVRRALSYFQADLLVHLVYVETEDLREVTEQGVSVVCCPSANATLGLRLPPIREMLDRKINVALGTDNVMLNPPDMLREMAFVLKMYRVGRMRENSLDSRDVLMMATINGARALKIHDNVGSINVGKSADIVALDFDAPNLRYCQDVLAAVVHRTRKENVRLVMINGEVVYDSNMEIQGSARKAL